MRKTKIILLIIGVSILVLFFYIFGIEKTINHLKKLNWKFVFIVGIHVISYIFYSYAWLVLIIHPVKSKDYYRLILGRIAGDALGFISTVGYFAGEPLRAAYVKKIIPFNTGLASAFLEKFGSDSLREVHKNYETYLEDLKKI